MSTQSAWTSSQRIIAVLVLTCLAVMLPCASAAQGAPLWRAEYFGNPTLSGQAVCERNESAIDYDWQNDLPDASVPADGFSARWTAYLLFEHGHYTFKAYTDGGVGLWVDAQLLIGQWEASGAAQYEEQVDLTAGYHVIRLEYRHSNGDAVVKLWWEGQRSEVAPARSQQTGQSESTQTVPAPDILTTTPTPLTSFNPNQVCRVGGPEESWYDNRSVHVKCKAYSAPTFTPAPPARTPCPTGTATSVPLGHQSNPVPLGEPVTFMDLGAECAIALEETMSGPAAYELRNQGAGSAAVPKEGCEYYLARFRLTYLLGCHNAVRAYRAADFAVELDGQMFSPTLSTWDKELDLTIYPAQEGTGWVIFEVPVALRAQRIRFTPSGSDLALYFSLP